MDNLLTVPQYYIKVLKIDNTVVAEPLLHSGVDFTTPLYVVGQRRELGEFKIQLRDVKDLASRFLLSTYNSLDYEQRVEIYEHPFGLGVPIFTGVITQLQGDLNSPAISGTSTLRRLETRRLRRYASVNTDAKSALQSFLKNYKQVATDTFSSLSQWTITSGDWAVSGNELTASTSNAQISFNTSFSAAQWENLKVSFDVNIPTGRSIGCNLLVDSPKTLFDSVDAYEDPAVDPPNNINFIEYYWNGVTSTIGQASYFGYAFGVYFHWDIYTWMESGGRRVILEVNKVPVLNYLDTRSGVQHSGQISFALGTESSVGTFKISNFVVSTFQNILKPGSIPATSSTINQVFNGESNLSAVEWVCQNQGWQFREIYQAGEGNDLLEAAATLGRDLSGKIILEENVNISNLTYNRTSEELATSFLLYGQGQDDYTAGFVYNSLAQWATYGIVEKEYQDPRIVDSATARLMAKQRADIYSLGKVSIACTILDPQAILRNIAIPSNSGLTSVWNNADLQTSMPLRTGDFVWLRVPSRNIDRKVQIVSITRHSATQAVDLIIDYFPWAGSQQAKSFQEQYLQLYRSWLNRMNSQTIAIANTGAATFTWYVWLRGYSPTVKVDALVASGTGNVSISIDGTDRSAALGGPWTGDIHLKDTTWLVVPGNHTIAFVFAATKTLHVALTSNVLS